MQPGRPALTSFGASAQLSITVGKACPDCIRGAIATRDLRAGDVVARIPNSLAIKLEELTGQRIYPAVSSQTRCFTQALQRRRAALARVQGAAIPTA